MATAFRATPLKHSPSLSSVLAEKLRAEIASKRLDVGARFPSDAEIARGFGVSRTVVREAVSALRAEGLVATQRGRGSVVVARLPVQPFGISQEELGSIDDILQISELRSAIESRSAALAAERRTDEDMAAIRGALQAVQDAVDRGEDAIKEDVELHLVIAGATHNSYFPRLMSTFSSLFIARQRVRGDLAAPEALRRYLELIQAQHADLVEAIADGDAARATEVMRIHLSGSRYRDLKERPAAGG